MSGIIELEMINSNGIKFQLSGISVFIGTYFNFNFNNSNYSFRLIKLMNWLNYLI